jgi:Lrp/AsnC family transcriptional regulator for asnA, asnC and gidA
MINRRFQRRFDELDYQIIQALRYDARASASDIARMINANERTVRKRIDRLTEMNVFRLTAVINPRAFGYALSADIFLEVDPAHEVRVLDLFKAMPQITYIAFGEGSRDLSIEACFKDSADLAVFLRQTLAQIPGIQVKGHALVPAILRNIDEWMPTKADFGMEEAA